MTVADSGGAVLLNITRTVRRFRIVPTALRTNQLYYNVYCVGLNTVFASVIPLLSLLYLNTRLTFSAIFRRKFYLISSLILCIQYVSQYVFCKL